MTTQEQARRIADLEAAFVSEMLGLETLTIVAAKATHTRDLEPVVQSWLADWGSYHARNGHSPLIKSALAVALDRLSVGRIAAAVWTFHHAPQGSAPELSTSRHQVVPQPATERHSLQLPARGPRGVRQVMTVDGQPIEAPACVVDFLRDAGGDGTARARPETIRKLVELLPWAAPLVARDPSVKVVNHKPLYRVGAELRGAICVQ